MQNRYSSYCYNQIVYFYCVYIRKFRGNFQKFLESMEISETTRGGKILFDANDPSQLYGLRCAERLFIAVAYELVDRCMNKRQLFDKLFSTLDSIPALVSMFQEAITCLHREQSVNSVCRCFRVSLKTTGKWRFRINNERLSASLARRVKQITGFNTSLRSAALEVCIHISEESIFIGIPITREPLSKRPYLFNNSLRSTVADALLSLANIQDGDIVADFTCGSSSILLQAAHDFRQKIFLLGFDCSWDALELSSKNINYLRQSDKTEPVINLLANNIFNDSFKYEVVDHIISDLPFGQMYGTEESAIKILQRVCDIFSNCAIGIDRSNCCCNSTAILLISAAHLALLDKMLKAPVRLQRYYPISLGITDAVIVLLTTDTASSSANHN
ncbi:unnamed protein product [Thelazia callipaeda]|uniref:UPF0020 domain-containing protein n=1 Tax=Thelazia callipaeda TaxID=103827 RepID=A0A0N5D577_THECL|nr:unnamed protein product [Thelazia callipaeda]